MTQPAALDKESKKTIMTCDKWLQIYEGLLTKPKQTAEARKKLLLRLCLDEKLGAMLASFLRLGVTQDACFFPTAKMKLF